MILSKLKFVEMRADEVMLARITFARANADCLNKKAPTEWGIAQQALRRAKRNLRLAVDCL